MTLRWMAVTLLLAGCATGADEPLSTTVVLGDASAEGHDNDTEDAEGTSAGTGLGGSGQVDATGSVDSTGSADGPGDDTTTAEPPPPICPVEADDVPCEVCGKEQCCAEYLACIADMQCACALDCYLAGGDTADCFVTCGASPPALNLFNCAAPACDGICV